jgi:hypothetical protein
MSTTTQLPAVRIDDEAFVNFIHLPTLYAGNLLTVEGAKKYTAGILEPVKSVDIQKVEALEMESLMEPVAELRMFLAEAKKEVEDGRKPHTQKMDAIKSLFTAVEKDFDKLDHEAQTHQIAWETEKRRRAKVAADAAALSIAKEQEAATIRLHITNAINRNFSTALINEITEMSATYYNKSSDDLPAYGEALKGWEPALDADTYNHSIAVLSSPIHSALHDGEERMKIFLSVTGDLYSTLSTEWAARVTAERDRLVDMIPSRLTEIAAGNTAAAEARQAVDLANVQAAVASDTAAKTEAVELKATTAVLEAAFSHSAATPALTKTKGARTKQKYVLTLPAAFVPIIQSWVKNDMALLSVEELTKKLSFMITAANERLNKGTTLTADGLSVVEDIKVSR